MTRSCWPWWVMGGHLDFILNVSGWKSWRVLSVCACVRVCVCDVCDVCDV